MQFADIKNDIAFRKIFGNENKTEILISFLNAVLKLEDKKQIVSVEILNPYQLARIAGSKSTILDVRAKEQNGHSYIVEMQVTDKIGLDKRIVYYGAKSYINQLDISDNYYKLKPVVFIGILNFDYLDGDNYLSRHLILDEQTLEHKLKDLEFNFIELPKFNKTENQLQSLIEKWIFFIKNAENIHLIPQNADDIGLKAAYIEADRYTWTKAELEEYEYARLRETDEITEKMFVIENRNIEIAKKLLKRNLSYQEIAEDTGLTVEQIQNL